MTQVGTIELIAKIDTSAYKKGASEIKNANQEIEGSTEKAGKSSDGIGSKLAGLAKTGLKTATVGVLGLGAAVAGLAIKGGISRALSIEDAQAKLRGLGHDANSVKNIMNNSLASVKGTAFGLGEAATTAANSVAAGIKPGKQLEGVLKTVANSAALAGTDMSEMGAIFNKVATSNKVQMDVINQLGDRGIPVIQFLSKELGKTAEETVELASAGKINFATFEKAMRAGVGDAAVEMGKTTRGSWQNMLAALSRVGEKIVTGPIAAVRTGMGGATEFIDNNSDKLVSAVESVIAVANKLFVSFGKSVPGIVATAKSFGKQLAPSIQGVANEAGKFLPIIGRIATEIGGPVVRAIKSNFVPAAKGTLSVLQALLSVTASVVNFLLDIKQVLVVAGSAWAAYRVAIVAQNVVSQVQIAYMAATQTQLVLLNGSLMLVRTSTIAQTVAQTALNLVMKANSIGLATAAVVALGVGLFALTRNTELTNTAQTRLNEARKQGKIATDNLKIAEDALKGAMLNAEGAALAVERAQLAYNDAVKQYGPKSLQAREAAYNLKRANDDLARSNKEVANKTKEAMKAEIEKNKRVKAIQDANNAVAASARNAASGYQAWADGIARAKKEDQKAGDMRGSFGKKALDATFDPGFGGRRALGGPVSAGKSYLVGENRDGSINKTTELFMPNSSGRIINAKDLQSAIGNSGGTSKQYNTTVNMGGIMARSTSDLRDIAKQLVGLIDEERAAKQQPLIMGGM